LTDSNSPSDTARFESEAGARLIDAFASTRRVRDRFLYYAGKRYERFLKDPRRPPHGVACILLNHWREIRDRFGFKVLEDLEDQIEQRVLEGLDEQDFFLKISDSSLIGILAPGPEGRDVEQWSRGMLERLTEPPYRIGTRQITPTFSIGFCWFDRRVRDIEEALLDAMQMAEQLSDTATNEFRVFVPDVAPEEELGSEDDIAETIREALKANRLRLVFQPLLAASSEESRFYQAWPRLISSSGRLIAARHFLKVARRQDLLGALQIWSIKHCLYYLVKIQQKASHIRLFVNVSPEAFTDETLVWLGKAFNRYPEAAPRLIAEFEAFHLEHRVSETLAAIERLRAMGVVLGVNSISRKHLGSRILDEVPLRFVRLGADLAQKLDRDHDGYDEFIAFVSRSHLHQRKVIVPEVREAQQVINFWQSGVDLIQGEYIEKPTTSIEPGA
jgi:EAL domain-containing protein (putative c-di-GMP-specific phosphodiesterase class I)/GGDEF domain-containing protein